MDNNQALKNEPRFERRKDARPSELTAAALELFVEKGFAATRLEDVAARAGVSKGTLYLYFDSKEELFKAVIQSAVVPVLAQGEQIFETFTGTASDLLRELVQGWWRLFGSTPLSGIPKLMISEASNFPEIAKYYHDNGHRPREAPVHARARTRRRLGRVPAARPRLRRAGPARAADPESAVAAFVRTVHAEGPRSGALPRDVRRRVPRRRARALTP